MATHDQLRELGLFDARAPRYTSYPPANHFSDAVDNTTTAKWLSAVPDGSEVSLYLHIPYCRRLCWFCACRTQGTATDRPLIPYLGQLYQELAEVDRHLGPNVKIGQIHFGGGTPTLLSPTMLRELGAKLAAFRPWSDTIEFSVEIDPTEVDQPRIDALAEIGMTRSSIGVQDFDPLVQESIGRIQSFEDTRAVVDMLRAAGVRSLNMDILFGLPHQTTPRMIDSVQKVLSLAPDRVALFGYAHVPWMAKRQVMIPSEALPDADERFELFETARDLFLDGEYLEIGIDHFAIKSDSMAKAAKAGTLRRNFQGYTDDPFDVLIGIGASAISRYPQGYAQNISASSRYATAVAAGKLGTERGHALSPDDMLRAAMIERLMCDFALDCQAVADRFDLPVDEVFAMTESLRARFAEQITVTGHRIELSKFARFIARLAAQEIDAYHMPEGRHSKAL